MRKSRTVNLLASAAFCLILYYLESREKEVVDIMMTLYDEQEVMRSYVESECYEAAQEAAQEAAKKRQKGQQFV